MKKFLAILAVLILCFLGGFYYLSNSIKSQIRTFYDTQNFKITKNEINNSIFETNGVVEGTITKEQFKEILTEIVQNLENSSLKKSQIDQILATIKKNEILPYDLDFRYTYKISHSPLGLSKGFSSDGVVKILTPELAVIAKKIFGTDEILKTHAVKTLNELDTTLTLANIDIKGLTLKNFIINSVSDNDQKIKSFSLNLDNLLMQNDKATLKLNALNFGTNFDSPIDLNELNRYYFKTKYSANGEIKEAVFQSEYGKIEFKNGEISNTTEPKNGEIISIEKSKIGELEILGVKFKDFVFDANMQIDTKFFDELMKFSSNYDGSAENGEIFNDFMRNFDQILGKGVKFKISELSMKNLNGNKISANLDFAFTNAPKFNTMEQFENEILDNLKLSGEIKTDSKISEFLSPYLDASSAIIALGIENSEFVQKSENGFLLKFNFENHDLIINDKISLKESGILEEFLPTNESKIAEKADEFDYMFSEFADFYDKNGKFDDISKMTSAELTHATPKIAYFMVENFACVKIETSENAVKIEKSINKYTDVCKKFYEIINFYKDSEIVMF